MAIIEDLRLVPSQPPDFLDAIRLQNESQGIYIVGHDKFYASKFSISNVFHRQIGSADELILGILSVFVIGCLAELVQTFLLRTNRNRRMIALNFLYASMIDELSHFHNIWSNRRGKERKLTRMISLPGKRNGLFISLVVLGVMLLVFIADVVAVIVTQPMEIQSTETEFNLQGRHPAGTTKGLAKFIRRTALDRGCVSPVILDARHKRNYVILACFKVESVEALTGEDDEIGEIKVGSWYHRGGFDHNVTFGDGHIHLRMRAEIFPSVRIENEDNRQVNHSARRVLFTSRDNEKMDHALFVQQRFIYAAIELNCNKYPKVVNCSRLLDVFTFTKKERTAIISLWAGKQGPVYEDVLGLETNFQVPLKAPFRTINAGLGDLVTSAVIEEVNNISGYERVIDDVQEEGVKGLMSEEARIAGALLISIVLVCLLGVLIVLRRIYRPISLASIAATHMNDANFVRVDASNDPNLRGVEGDPEILQWNTSTLADS